MSLVRLLTAGRSDGDKVYQRIRATASADDQQMWEELMASAVGRAGARLIDVTTRAAAESVAVAHCREWWQAWSALSLLLQMRLIGVWVVTAVVTHAVMTAAAPQPGAWRWLVPGLAGAFGLLVVALSYGGPRGTESTD